jgi:hypothetical protein|tara:strand:+ start:6784 stop:7284 length:501 start_codon:yes stop_codon:yes gene_type:complete
MSEDNIDDDAFEGVNDLIEQLQGGTGEISDIVEASEKVNLSRDDLEEFILENQATLIKDSVDVLQIMKQYVAAAPNAEDVESFAELLRATSTAIDNLTKLHTSNQRVDTQVKVKQMDIDAKKINNDNNNKTMLIGTREEIFKKMLSDSSVIDIKVEDVVEDSLDVE